MNAAPNFIIRKPVPDVFDEDMSRADLVDVLRRLKFDNEDPVFADLARPPSARYLIAAPTERRT